jgi:hypothetical protein
MEIIALTVISLAKNVLMKNQVVAQNAQTKELYTLY